jgi:hypothetical protein
MNSAAIVRLAVAAGLAAALWALLSPSREISAARRTWTTFLLLVLAWTALEWTHADRVYPEAYPPEIAPLKALGLAVAGIFLSTGAFASAGGKGNARRGAAFGLALAAVGFCASRWPQLARAVELGGGVFAGPFLAALLPFALALTAAGIAAALLHPELRSNGAVLVVLAAFAWAAPTLVVESALSRWWGYGPRSLNEAAGIPTNEDAPRLTVLRLSPSRGRTFLRTPVRMSGEGVDLSPDSLSRLEDFLQRSGYRGVFAAEALTDVRLGWRQWWEAERALDAAMVAVPGRAHPDYRRALELLRAGPIVRERYEKLLQLDAASKASTAGFEEIDESQYIFEGFSAAYARFGDEENARRWLYRIDNLWPNNERRIEVTPVEDFHQGVVSGSVLIDDRPALGVRVGLFYMETSSATGATSRLLSSVALPNDDGGFRFENLGPGVYELDLLGRPSDFVGRVSGSPGFITIGFDRPEAILPPVRIDRERLAVPQAFAPAGLPEAPTPEVPEPALRLPRPR